MTTETTETTDGNDKAPAAGPTPAQRQGLARAAAARALARRDPLSANLGVVGADVLALTHALGARVQAALAGPAAPGREELARDAAEYLRLVRVFGGLQRLERQAAAPPGGGEKPAG